MAFRKYDIEGNQLGIDDTVTEFEESRTEQHHKEEVDINNIVRRHAGQQELIASIQSLQSYQFDDVTSNDFQEHMNLLLKAKDSFYKVPNEIRKQFDHDPAKFLDFVYNPENKDKLIEMGLANAPVVQEPMQVAVVSQPETPPPGS